MVAADGDAVAASVGAGDADSHHADLAAATGEATHAIARLCPRVQVHQQLRQLHFLINLTTNGIVKGQSVSYPVPPKRGGAVKCAELVKIARLGGHSPGESSSRQLQKKATITESPSAGPKKQVHDADVIVPAEVTRGHKM